MTTRRNALAVAFGPISAPLVAWWPFRKKESRPETWDDAAVMLGKLGWVLIETRDDNGYLHLAAVPKGAEPVPDGDFCENCRHKAWKLDDFCRNCGTYLHSLRVALTNGEIRDIRVSRDLWPAARDEEA